MPETYTTPTPQPHPHSKVLGGLISPIGMVVSVEGNIGLYHNDYVKLPVEFCI